jgi:thiamine-monophosphate kinase
MTKEKTHPNPTETLQDIGEQGLLKRLHRFCRLVGDDGAVLSVRGDRRLVVTTDVLVDGVHFSLGLTKAQVTTPPHAVGWRSAAANLSDLAAMGAIPIGITIGLSLPPEMPVVWIEEIYEGITDCLKPWNVHIIGGDIVRSQQVSLAITAFGEVEPDKIIQRHCAKPGDRIVMTGIHGRSRVGLELLLGRELNLTHPENWIKAHQYPQPRLDLVSQLPNPIPAGMDSSDGLADAVLQICRSSHVSAILDQEQILSTPEIQTLIQVVGLEQALEWVLYGGEDFELVLCMGLDDAIKFCKQTGSRTIGTITASNHLESEVILNGDVVIRLSIDRGFQHFKD